MPIVVFITLIAVYLSLVIGTYKKFKINGINFSFFARSLFIFLPALILLYHVKMALENFSKDKHASFEIIKMATVNYPVAVGILIEVSLEKYAHKAVFGSSLKYIKKTPIKVNAEIVTRQRASVLDVYQKTTVNLAT